MSSDVVKIIEEILLEKVDTETTKDQTNNWDSLNHIKIIIALQSNFNIKLSVDEISSIKSVQNIIDIVAEKQNL